MKRCLWLVMAAVAMAAVRTLAGGPDLDPGPPIITTQPAMQQAKAPNEADSSSTTQPSAVQAIKTAADVAVWSRQGRNAVALAVASRIMASVSAKPMGKIETRTGTVEQVESPEKKPVELTAEMLLAEAKAMAGEDRELLAAIDAVQKAGVAARGALGGARISAYALPARAWVAFDLRFTGGDLAEVAVVGDGQTELKLSVYDENGTLLRQSSETADRCYVSWTPRWTGRFTIKVENAGRAANSFQFITN